MPRIARVVAANFPHHVTQRGNNKEVVFFDDEDRRRYIKILNIYCEKYDVAIWAYCLMPNHMHLLAVPAAAESLAKCIGGVNLVYTQHVNRKYQRSGRLWQNRFFSTIVDTEQYVWAVARYIELNPVKANLVNKPENYQWSSCNTSTSGNGDDLVTGHEWLDGDDRKTYKEFLRQHDSETEEEIRLATSTGRPLGSEFFIKKLELKLSRRLLPRQAGRPKKLN